MYSLVVVVVVVSSSSRSIHIVLKASSAFSHNTHSLFSQKIVPLMYKRRMVFSVLTIPNTKIIIDFNLLSYIV